jgi:hypothetical protein
LYARSTVYSQCDINPNIGIHGKMDLSYFRLSAGETSGDERGQTRMPKERKK